MTINDQLALLFSEWKKLYENPIDFYIDGVINETQYRQNGDGSKLLFIAKEANESNHPDEFFRNFVAEWNNDEKPPQYGFAKRISEWAYGILNNFPPYTDAMDKIAHLKRIAFMNLKKSAGGGSTKAGSIEKLVSSPDHREFILKEIEIINPDIIVLGTSQKEEIRTLFAAETEWENSGYMIKVARCGGRRIIDFYHPSSRNAAPAAYSLLQNVYQSKSFLSLLL